MSGAVVWADQTLICRDGTELVARVWRPDGEGSWPVLLMRQPYGRAIASTPTYAHPSWYAAAGFVVVVQDVRGTGDSGGSFQGFAQEALDSAESVVWARRLRGSNGRLGTYGFSYQGLTQLLNHDPLGRSEALPDALAPAMCGLDERLHWCSSGGAHWWALSLAWGLQLAALQCRRRGDAQGWQAIRQSLQSGVYLESGLELLERHDPTNMVLAWLQRDPASAEHWPVHPVNPLLWQRPMLLIGGWHDPQLEGVLDLYGRALAAGGTPNLRIGAWTHLNWSGGIDTLQLAFFNRALGDAVSDSGERPEPEPGLALQCMRSQLWLAAAPQSAPTAQPQSQAWGLVSSGLAASAHGEGELRCGQPGHGRMTLVHDPWRAAPGRGGHLALDAGLCERADLDARSDVACFQTLPLSAPLQLQGRPVLSLTAAADQPGFDLVVAVSAVTASGTVQQLAIGVARFGGEDGRKCKPSLVTLQPLLARLEPGERLRVSIAAAAWPLIAVNPGRPTLPCGPVAMGHRVITLAVDLFQAELRFDSLPIAAIGANCGQNPSPH